MKEAGYILGLSLLKPKKDDIMDNNTIYNSALAILSSIITGGFVLFCVEISNRKKREENRHEIIMGPLLEKLSSFCKLVFWYNGRIIILESQNGKELELKKTLQRIAQFGARIIAGEGIFVESMILKEICQEKEDINKIWSLIEQIPLDNLYMDEDRIGINDLITEELKQINVNNPSAENDVSLLAKISGIIYKDTLEKILMEERKHRNCKKLFSLHTGFVLVSACLDLLLICLMLCGLMSRCCLILSTLLVVALFTITLTLFCLNIQKQTRWFGRLF